MTAFILVAGAHTGSWIWQAVADRLRESGAQAYPVTLTGMGERGHAAGPDTDLETHIHDLLRVIDRTDAAEVVLVGHCYGIYPVLGAADRRPERIARIVHLDAGMPQHGDQALTLVPDQAVRDRLLHRAGPAEDDWRIPPPPLQAWQRWGSVAGLSPAVLARLAGDAVPQPARTLTQPLRLSKAVSELPKTGVLCTANGSSIAMVEALVGLGDPRFQVLTDPRVSFFELDTGHWPMLSCPDEVAETLVRAAAREGHRVAAAVNEQPAHLRPFLLDVPERPRERVGRVDLHLPDDLAEADRPRPAVVFVHGGPVHPDVRPTPRDWPGFVGYGRYVAGMGVVGVTLDHRLHDLADYGRAAEDIAEAVDLVRADPRVDGDRVALWYFSSGGLLSADRLAAPPPWLRCVAASYPILAPLPNWGLVDSRFRPADAVRTAGRLPIVLTRVELERAEIAVTVEEFLAAAEKCDADVEVIDVPLGHHGFETIDHTEQARDAVERAVRSVLEHLRR
ncbi:alpha/beta hydrolase [Streptomyces sp. NBC_01340]|uniref:alpha/beta fold hydrolase n=1 Tax=unclassified Streptomyces TaxID=2593676 RepID=UPI0022532546|nr:MULTISPECIES: alpha/beta fold hydrolase [unclassified Streptomyces]MCX4458302.1 alpha/beta hydrolase [Streptomyces sp. NBC_01719]MCX4497659.1 alpha/beta hydrolase [Streptomyces sp. NBC_01728]MCX4596338.1 alpha/beta hydrolase [Streptomyces sp. NBC_01549]WSI42483.1 alpha/beta hydrolase [Streptomyces sp. NBC_01340]